MEWLLKENKRIVDTSACVNYATKSIQFSNKAATPISDIDSDKSISKTVDKANKVFANIETALKKNDIQKVTALQSEYNSINKQITHKLNMQLNDWAFHKSKVLDSDQKNMEIQIKQPNYQSRCIIKR